MGAAGVAYLVKNFAPEARGHGVPEVMDAIHYNKGIIRPVVAAIKSIASAISIGSGGSVGREGPIIQIGSSFGSSMAQMLRLPAWARLTLIACGAGGGIAATFNTPVGGILFAVEIMMHEVSARTLVPVTISTVTATYIGRLAFGQHPSFIIPSFQTLDFRIVNPMLLLSYIVLGILAGMLAALFIRSIYWFEDIFEKRIKGGYYRQHLLGMALVGLLFYVLMIAFGEYYTEGVGYATIQNILIGWKGPALLLVLLCAAKLLATSLTLGSGASGGIFSPALFMGASLGGAYGFLLAKIFPFAGISPAAFAVAGMAGLIGGSTGAALAAIVMIFEMTLDYNVIIPMTLTVAIAYEVRKLFSPESIYSYKLVRRGHNMPEGLETNAYISRRAHDLMNTRISLVPDSLTNTDLMHKAAEQPNVEYFLLENKGEITGVSLRGQKSITDFCILPENFTVTKSLGRMRSSGAQIAVVSLDGSLAIRRVKGIITRMQLEDALVESIERYNDKL